MHPRGCPCFSRKGPSVTLRRLGPPRVCDSHTSPSPAHLSLAVGCLGLSGTPPDPNPLPCSASPLFSNPHARPGSWLFRTLCLSLSSVPSNPTPKGRQPPPFSTKVKSLALRVFTSQLCDWLSGSQFPRLYSRKANSPDAGTLMWGFSEGLLHKVLGEAPAHGGPLK